LHSGIRNIDGEKLAKILAYVGSEHDGEALAALHAARRLMLSGGVETPNIQPRKHHPIPENAGPKVSAKDAIELKETIKRLHTQLASKSREATKLTELVYDLQSQVDTLDMALENKTREATGWQRRAWRNYWAAGQR